MNESDWAYLAGIIDGEGYIGLNRKGPGRYELCVAVKSTSHRLLRRIRVITGCGYLRGIPDDRELEGGGIRQALGEWRAFGENAAQVLERVRGRLIVKEVQAGLGIVFQRQAPELRRTTGPDYHAQLMWHNGPQTRLRANAVNEAEATAES